MCRLVIVAVIFATFVSCVLAETASLSHPNVNKTVHGNGTNCVMYPTVVLHRNNMKRCFNKIVDLHFNSSTELQAGDCKNSTDFGEKLGIYFDSLLEACNSSMKLDTTIIEKLVDYSLQNNSFKTFYEDIDCVKGVETNISNTCVKARLGFFNISKEHKHLPWTRKGELQYDKNTCGTSLKVKNCVVVKLYQCMHPTSEYVTKLFDFARELGNCSLYPPPATVPPPTGSADPWYADTASWLTTPVIIVLGIGGVVVVAAIITIIVLKCKN